MAEGSTAPSEILVVEDEPLIAMYLEDVLTRSGFAVAGPFDTVDLGAAAARRFDGAAALVDLCLAGDDATIVAEILANRRIPFIVMTGLEEIAPSRATATAPILRKPFLIGDLLGALDDICQHRRDT